MKYCKWGLSVMCLVVFVSLWSCQTKVPLEQNDSVSKIEAIKTETLAELFQMPKKVVLYLIETAAHEAELLVFLEPYFAKAREELLKKTSLIVLAQESLDNSAAIIDATISIVRSKSSKNFYSQASLTLSGSFIDQIKLDLSATVGPNVLSTVSSDDADFRAILQAYQKLLAWLAALANK